MDASSSGCTFSCLVNTDNFVLKVNLLKSDQVYSASLSIFIIVWLCCLMQRGCTTDLFLFFFMWRYGMSYSQSRPYQISNEALTYIRLYWHSHFKGVLEISNSCKDVGANLTLHLPCISCGEAFSYLQTGAYHNNWIGQTGSPGPNWIASYDVRHQEKMELFGVYFSLENKFRGHFKDSFSGS